VLSYANNGPRKYQSFFVLEVQLVKSSYLRLCHIVMAINKAQSFGQFSLIFSTIKICHQVKNHTNCPWIFNFCKIS